MLAEWRSIVREIPPVAQGLLLSAVSLLALLLWAKPLVHPFVLWGALIVLGIPIGMSTRYGESPLSGRGLGWWFALACGLFLGCLVLQHWDVATGREIPGSREMTRLVLLPVMGAAHFFFLYLGVFTGHAWAQSLQEEEDEDA